MPLESGAPGATKKWTLHLTKSQASNWAGVNVIEEELFPFSYISYRRNFMVYTKSLNERGREISENQTGMRREAEAEIE